MSIAMQSNYLPVDLRFYKKTRRGLCLEGQSGIERLDHRQYVRPGESWVEIEKSIRGY